MANIARTQQFIYLQSKARHYDNLKKSKPTVNTFNHSNTLSPKHQHTSRLEELILSPYKHSLNTTHMQQYEQMKINENLVNGILSIRNAKRPQIYSHNNYSRYNDAIEKNERNRRSSIKFYESERNSKITVYNKELGNKILRVKPSIGTMAEWNQRYETNKSLKKIASRYGNQGWEESPRKKDSQREILNDKSSVHLAISPNKKHKKVLPIYSNQTRYVPEHYRTFMGNDGSTVALKDKIFELPKQIKREYFQRLSSRKNLQNAKRELLNYRIMDPIDKSAKIDEK